MVGDGLVFCFCFSYWVHKLFLLTIFRYLDYDTILWVATPERIKSYCVAVFLLPPFFLNQDSQEKKKNYTAHFQLAESGSFFFPVTKHFTEFIHLSAYFLMRLFLLPHTN